MQAREEALDCLHIVQGISPDFYVEFSNFTRYFTFSKETSLP